MYVPLASLASGCGSSAYDRLRSDTQIPRLAPLIAASRAMPRDVVLVPTARAGEPTVRLAVHKTGNPDAAGPIVVMVHGVFSNADAWRYVLGDLGRDHAVWLVELPGCGASDKPPPDALPPDGYSPGALADRVMQAVAGALAAEPPGRRVVLGGHSLGATIVLRALADPDLRDRHAAVRSRISGMVLATPVDVGVGISLPVMEEIATLAGWKVGFADAIGLLREKMAQATLDAYSDPADAPREEADRGIRIFADPTERHAMQAMIRQAIPRLPSNYRPDWAAIDALVAQYVNVDVPVHITCGLHDEAMPAAMSYKLATQIPGATLEPLPDCKHSPHLECPVEVAEIVRRFARRVGPAGADAGRVTPAPAPR